MSVRICWLGHSALWFEQTSGSKKTNLLIDPFLTGNPSATAKADSLPADYILVSHGHGDHIGDTEAIAGRTHAIVISNYEIACWLNHKGVKHTHGMSIGGAFQFPFGKVKLTQAIHGSSLPDGSYGGNPAGFHIHFNDGPRIYDAGDTGLFGDMRLIGEEGIDLAFLPIGDNFTMGLEDGLKAIKMLQPRKVIPIHYNTFDVIRQDPEGWQKLVERETSTKVIIPRIGEWITV